MIPLFLQALDFLNKTTTSMLVVDPLAQTANDPLAQTAIDPLAKKAIKPLAKKASEQHRLQHTFTLDHCYCSRTLNVRCQPLKWLALMLIIGFSFSFILIDQNFPNALVSSLGFVTVLILFNHC